MSRSSVLCWAIGIAVLSVIACNRGPNLDNPQVQQAWIQAIEEKMVETLEVEGQVAGIGLRKIGENLMTVRILKAEVFWIQKIGENQMKVVKYARHGKGVCVVFVDRKNDPPQCASAAYLLPTSEDGYSWGIAEYIIAAGTGGKMETAIFEICKDVPNMAVVLDRYLFERGIQREELRGEKMFNLF